MSMREFLKGLDLDKEMVDTIMAEHGKLITGSKEKADSLSDELKAVKDSLAAANADIANYKS